jgi:cellulose synthase/poly-beta-1,6-N-acetylglucosamine synthase-like glycosyltransferase/peptidoglycan/xylan/chitin deacetylase (PgdA/CDA1 family)/spore germination protein YaaH
MKQQVFHDPSGRRARFAGQAVAAVLAFITLMTAGFAATLALSPKLPGLTLKDPNNLTALHVESKLKKPHGKPAWSRVPHRPTELGHRGNANVTPFTGAKAVGGLNIGFYVSWDNNSRDSLRAHVKDLDVVSPQWVALTDSKGGIAVTTDPQADAMIRGAPNKPAVLPLVHNSADSVFNGPRADALLASPAARRALIASLVETAQKKGWGGYVFDFENMSDAAVRDYPSFIAEARTAFKPSGREVWVTAPFDGQGWPLPALGKASDTLVLMAYDEHYGGGDPGPAAGQDWFGKTMPEAFKGLDPARTVLALAAYGYDWAAPRKGVKGSANVVTFQEAMVLARDAGVDVAADRDSLNPNFAYKDNDGVDHTVWFLDAVTMFNQVHAADAWRPRGYALWRMGSEDPGVWQVLGRGYGAAMPATLKTVESGPDVAFDGNGEVLKVTATPTNGQRTLAVDRATGMISAAHYDVLPGGYVVQRYGARPGEVALTFDDGPDPRWTPKLLDILKAKHVPATFFVVGENMQNRPDLVQREVAEGHTVGSHTWTHPNIGEIPNPEVVIELTATQRLFETLTGKSMRLFRPPFLGDADPFTAREVMPLIAAQKLGYLIVGLRNDPDDWKKPDPTHIVDSTLERLAEPGPTTHQIVLLHDAGGDRSRTVEALPRLIDALRAHGYKIVSVADLAGMTPAQAMPPANRSSVELMLDRVGFGLFRWLDDALRVLFLTAIALGLARLVFLATLSLAHRIRAPRKTPAELDPTTGPLVSVLIPCFNEEKVIVSSVSRILASAWTNLEIIVLDDGSSDHTATEVEDHFANEARVRLMRFENGGKASALNRGLVLASGEIVVALDADTQFAPETIGLLARWFTNPKVGAVAGNAIVGNRTNIVTRWQALEYVTAQNLERRALSALGCVTVVPGAVGAWRKSTLLELGGYPPDTLAEDQDLTMAVQQAGWRVEFDPQARAYTEAPDTVQGLLKQRFRWSFGTLQCLWKHRDAMFSTKHAVFGFVALPQIWLFQIVLATAAPLIDLAIVWSLASALIDRFYHPVEWSPDNLIQALLYWAVFILVDLSAAALGMAMERRAPWADLPWIPVQRFGYRQLMYYVVIKAVVTAVRGPRVGWGKLERRATVKAHA